MAGTKAGGAKAAATNKARHGANYYAEMGKIGGEAPHSKPRWFEQHPELAAIAGAKGGRISRRGAAKNPTKKGLSAGLTPGSRTRREK